MKFHLTIDCDNAAFEEGNELWRLLVDITAQVDQIRWSDPPTEARILDINGNSVGEWRLE